MSEHMDFTCATHIADLDAWLARAMAAEARVEELRAALEDARITLTQSESAEPEDDISEDEVGRCWQHRCSDGVGGCTAVSEDARINALRSIQAALASGSTLAGEVHVGSERRTIETIVGRILAGEPWKQVVNDYRWDHDVPPDLSSLGRVVKTWRRGGGTT